MLKAANARSFGGLLVGLTAMLSAGPTRADEIAIRRARADSNAGIAAHDAARATAAISENALIVVSGGGLVSGAQAMREAFERSFANPDFITYVRAPTRLRLSGTVAAEEGRWTGRWRERTVSGVYLARWDRTSAGWRISSEQYIPLGCDGPGCP